MEISRNMGVNCIEASADTECDPFYQGLAFLKDWAREVRRESRRTGVRVVNHYTGHGTYTTLGLAHPDKRVSRRMRALWLEKMVDLAAGHHAGLGFFCHAFSQATLQDASSYAKALDALYGKLAGLAAYAARKGLPSLGLEQMYSPHQVPWTMETSLALLREVYRRSGCPLYLTLDTGHQSGQRKYSRPSRSAIHKALGQAGAGRPPAGLWLGTEKAQALFAGLAGAGGARLETGLDELEALMDQAPYLFSGSLQNGNTYAWLQALGAYSPIIHLQQTDGKSSPHWPFDARHNAQGVITAPKVLRALRRAYAGPEPAGLPPRCQSIYLTLEIFVSNADYPAEILKKIKDSVDYWRRFIPRDGMKLSRLAPA
jgi:hypothetical protein